ncbi:MAG: protein kinase domain-containing protein [Phycisphaerae bacterium]
MSTGNEKDLILAARKQAAGARVRSADARDDGMQAAELLGAALPNYRLLGGMHQGGQGVVYKAMQLATMRTVAIKVLREGPLARPADRVRFEREVQLLAGLRHPNIVTIHDSGVAGGFFYYVMDYIEGRPLHHAIADFESAASTPSDRGDASSRGTRSQSKTQSRRAGTKSKIAATLALFAKVCEAVNAAHLRGVIHRDLKPGNILVDASGEPHVLDFGLAKETSDGSSAQAGFVPMSVMTQTGQFIGSLPWASPEQAEGHSDHIDVRTDVYSLGVVLYQMLTGEFPYRVIGPMREVLSEISSAEPKRPSDRNPAISGDVDTIVLKCLSKERERRYQSAGELARDVRRYLAGEPIEARRDSALYVLRRSIQQHRVAIAIGAAFVLVAGGAAAISYQLYLQQVEARNQADAARAEVQEQSDRAERFAGDARERFEDARETIEFLIDQVSSELQHVFGASQVRRDILKLAYERLSALAEQQPDDPRLRVDIARLHLRTARLASELQQRDEVTRQIAAALALVEPLYAADATDHAAAAAVGEALRYRADDQLRAGANDAAAADLERATAIYTALCVAEPTEAKYLHGQSLIVERQAIVAQRSGVAETDQRLTETMLGMKRRLVELEPENAEYQNDLGIALERHANRMMRLRRLDEAEAFVRESMDVREKLVASNPESRNYIRGLSMNHEQMANLCAMREDREVERSWNAKMYDGKKRLVALAPNNWQVQHDYAICLDRLGAQADRDGDLAQAAAYHDESIAIYRRLLDSEPTSRRFKIDLMYGLRLRAKIGQKRDETAIAAGHWREVITLATSMPPTKVDEPDRLELLGEAHLALATLDANGEKRASHARDGLDAARALLKLRPESRKTKQLIERLEKLVEAGAAP